MKNFTLEEFYLIRVSLVFNESSLLTVLDSPFLESSNMELISDGLYDVRKLLKKIDKILETAGVFAPSPTSLTLAKG